LFIVWGVHFLLVNRRLPRLNLLIEFFKSISDGSLENYWLNKKNDTKTSAHLFPDIPQLFTTITMAQDYGTLIKFEGHFSMYCHF
ncbi:hypothetical protein L9F63_007781, partial [Diploptera punctata]